MRRPLVARAKPAASRLLVALVAISCGSGGASPAKSAPRAEVASASATPRTAPVAAVPTDLLLPSMPGTPALPSMPMGGTAPLPPPGQRPPCAKDEDCWSSTCCPATAAEHCIHSALAQKCGLVDVKCAKSETHYDCVCVESQCAGRLRP